MSLFSLDQSDDFGNRVAPYQILHKCSGFLSSPITHVDFSSPLHRQLFRSPLVFAKVPWRSVACQHDP